VAEPPEIAGSESTTKWRVELVVVPEFESVTDTAIKKLVLLVTPEVVQERSPVSVDAQPGRFDQAQV
jgi:hypothetical protein